MKRRWVVRIHWSSGAESMGIRNTRQEARAHKKFLLSLGGESTIEKITIHKAQDFKSGRFYISGKVHY